MTMLNKYRQVLRVCTECPVPHFENCTTCFGFGMRWSPTEGVIPVTAKQAFDSTTPPFGATMCFECGSTVNGVPK